MPTLEKFYKCIISDKQEKKIIRRFYIRASFITFFIPILIIYTSIYLPLNIYYDIIDNQFMISVLTGVEFLLVLPMFIYIMYFDNAETIKKLQLNKRLFIYIYLTRKYICNMPKVYRKFSIRKMVISSLFIKLWYLFDELEVNSKNLFIYQNRQLEISIASIKSILFQKRKSYDKETEESHVKLNNLLIMLLELYFLKNEQEDYILCNNIFNKSDFEKYEIKMQDELIKLIDECKVQELNINSSSKTILGVLKGLYFKWRKLILILIFMIIVIMIIYFCNKFIVVNNSVAVLLAMAGGGIFQIIGKIIKSKTPTDKENKDL